MSAGLTSTAFSVASPRLSTRSGSGVVAPARVSSSSSVCLFSSPVSVLPSTRVGLRKWGALGAWGACGTWGCGMGKGREEATLVNSHSQVTCNLTDDFFSGPSKPARVRPLYQVVIFSLTTNLLWYGWYKYCVEEELLAETGEGLGGSLVLLPFVVGVASPLFIGDRTLATGCVAAGLAWILAMQYWWLRRVNELYSTKLSTTPPLNPTWAFVPPLNIVVGLRAIHFLAVAWGADPTGDPVVNWFPFLGVPQLSVADLVTKPRLWVSFGGRSKDGE